jgi:predicted peptidase
VRTVDPGLQSKIQFLNLQYLVYLPTGNTDAKLPLLIFLHGAGEVGSDIHQDKGKPTAIWEGIRKFSKGPCIIVAPQCLKTAKGERGIWTRREKQSWVVSPAAGNGGRTLCEMPGRAKRTIKF